MGKRSVSPDRSRSRSPKRRRDDSESDGDKGRRSDDRRRRRDDSRSRSRSRDRNPSRRNRSRSPGRRPPLQNGNRAQPGAEEPERERQPLALGRAGGVYIPPFKLAQMMAEVEDKTSAQYQRMTWDALRKSINGLVNKVNSSNIKYILPEVFSENLIRGRGLFCRSIMKSQMASPAFTPVYAALVAVINTKFPEIGELLLHRVVTQFKRSFKRNDKPVCSAALKFIAHLANQQIVHEVLPLEVTMLLLETPTDDGVEVASDFLKECGCYLQDVSPQGLNAIFERLRGILHEGESVGKRTQYVIEGLFAVRKHGFEESGFPAVPQELDLVETSDQITHELSLEDPLDTQINIDVFKEDPEFAQHEAEYEAIRKEILGEDDESDDDDGSGSGEDESDSEDEDEPIAADTRPGGPIMDQTGTNLVNLRRTIYLTIMSALDFEEAGHKLLKMGIPEGLENELAAMIIECCAQEKTFIKYYALLAERFCKLKRAYADCFAEDFVKQYELIHRLETNKLRNVAKLFAHLFATDALTWSVMGVIRLTEDDTTSSSRIFIKILFQELAETLGLKELNKRLNDPTCLEWFEGIFPKDSPRSMRFSINFFTSIGLGGLTDALRDYLAKLPQLLAQQQAAIQAEKKKNKKKRKSDSSDSDTSSGSDTSSSDSDTSSSSGSDSDTSSSSGSDSSTSSSGSDSSGTSSSDSEDDRRGRRRRKSRSPPSSRRRRSSRSPTPSPSRRR